MAKSLLKIEARKLRSKGKSINEIVGKVNAAKSTISLWTRDIILSREQLEKLRKKQLRGSEIGRLKGALIQKGRREKLLRDSAKEGTAKLKRLTNREFLIAGTALYWGEGCKKSRDVEFCNSDQRLIKFMVNWLKTVWQLNNEELTCRVEINGIHKPRESLVKSYWSNYLDIPLSQFRKTSFSKIKSKKIYANHNNYYGTLIVRVVKPARFYYRILGLIEGLSLAGSGLVSRGVS